jgi:hypothetical protein
MTVIIYRLVEFNNLINLLRYSFTSQYCWVLFLLWTVMVNTLSRSMNVIIFCKKKMSNNSCVFASIFFYYFSMFILCVFIDYKELKDKKYYVFLFSTKFMKFYFGALFKYLKLQIFVKFLWQYVKSTY